MNTPQLDRILQDPNLLQDQWTIRVAIAELAGLVRSQQAAPPKPASDDGMEERAKAVYADCRDPTVTVLPHILIADFARSECASRDAEIAELKRQLAAARDAADHWNEEYKRWKTIAAPENPPCSPESATPSPSSTGSVAAPCAPFGGTPASGTSATTRCGGNPTTPAAAAGETPASDSHIDRTFTMTTATLVRQVRDAARAESAEAIREACVLIRAYGLGSRCDSFLAKHGGK